MRFLLVLVVPFTTVLPTGCGDDENPPPPPADSGILFDARPRDTAVPMGDAGDAAFGFDADFPSCMTLGMSETFDIGTDTRLSDQVIEVAPGPTSFALAWTSSPVGAADIQGRIIAASGAPGPPVMLTSDPFISVAPQLAYVDGGWLFAWVDNNSRGFEVYIQSLDVGLAAVGAPVRLSDNTVRDDAPDLMAFGAGYLASWVEDDMFMGTRIANTRVLDATGAPTTGAMRITMPPTGPTTPYLGPRAGGASMVWVESAATGANDILLLPLDTSGAATGPVARLSTEMNAAGTVDAALTESGGGVVFDVAVGGRRPEVRFRSVDGSGGPLDVERILTLAPETASGPSIARFGGGFVAAWRSLSEMGRTEPVIRLATLGPFGDIIDTVDLGPASASGGRVTIRVSGDGTAVLVAWADIGATATTIRVTRLQCGS